MTAVTAAPHAAGSRRRPGARVIPTIILLLASATCVATGTLTASQLRSALLRAEERLFTHAWQIEQLLPDSARDGGEVLLSDRR